MNDEAEFPFMFSKDRRVIMPIALLVTLIITVAISYSRLTYNENKIQQHEAAINSLTVDQRTTREILIRIDENVKDLRRAGSAARP